MAVDLGSLASLLQRIADTPGKPALDLLETALDDPDLELESRLGAGGMGVVYLARDRKLDREVAVKSHRLGGGADGRLLAEAQAMARLAHPNVVAVYDVRSVGGHLLLLMEYVSGDTLRAWQKRKPRSRAEILDVFMATGAGLAAAHTAGLVHRDFKPENVIVGDDGRPRVVDFGLAREVTDFRPTRDGEPTRDGGPTARETSEAVAGTLLYMAPEQFEGKADSRTDQFAFCLTLAEAIYGEHPLLEASREQLRDPAQRREHLETGAISALSPRWLRRVLTRGLAADPADRFPTMNALLAAIRRGRDRRRRGALAAIFVTGVAAATGALYLSIPMDEPSCASGDQHLAGVWDPEIRAQASAGVVASGLSHAEQVWELAGPRADSYASRWADARVALCEARRDDQLSERAFDLATACLDRGRAQLLELAAQLARADRPIINGAIETVDELPDPATCTDTSRLALAIEPPERAIAADVATLRTELGRTEARSRLGLTDALQRGRSAVATARALEYQPALAEALLSLSYLEHEADHHHEALAALEEALALAYATSHDDLVPDILAGIMRTSGELGRDDVDRWYTLADAAIDRGTVKPRRRGPLNCIYATLAANTGHHEKALEHGARCVELTERGYGPNTGKTAMAHYARGAAEIASGHYSEAETTLERALAVARRSFGPAHLNVGMIHRARARAARRLGKYDRAAEYAASALEIDELVFGEGDPRLHGNYGLLAAILTESGQLSEGLPHFETAHELLVALDGVGQSAIAQSLGNLAIMNATAGDNDRAATLAAESLAVFEAHLDAPDADLVNAYTTLGTVERYRNNLDPALEAHERSVALLDEVFSAEHPLRINSLVELGHTLSARGEYPRSVHVLREAVALLENPDAPPSWAAEARFALARALAASGHDGAEAHRYAHAARAGYSALGPGFATQIDEIDDWLAAR